MSFTEGPCIRCGESTMYANSEPDYCSDCRLKGARIARDMKANNEIIKANRKALKNGNRKARRMMASVERRGGPSYKKG